jgi:hypothetical protein
MRNAGRLGRGSFRAAQSVNAMKVKAHSQLDTWGEEHDGPYGETYQDMCEMEKQAYWQRAADESERRYIEACQPYAERKCREQARKANIMAKAKAKKAKTKETIEEGEG